MAVPANSVRLIVGSWLVGMLMVGVGGIAGATASRQSDAGGTESLLAAGLVQAMEVPDSWQASIESPPSPKLFAGVRSCKKISGATRKASKLALGAQALAFFDPESSARITDSVLRFRNVEAASAYVGAFRTSKTDDCLGGITATSLDLADRETLLRKDLLSSKIAEEIVGYRTAGTLQETGRTVVSDFLVVRVASIVLVLQVIQPDEPSPYSEEVVEAAVARLRTEIWEAIAACETGGDWGYGSRDGQYSGGLGLRNDTWVEFGGTEFAARAGLASKEQQIAVAERVREEHGYSTWGCGITMGFA